MLICKLLDLCNVLFLSFSYISFHLSVTRIYSSVRIALCSLHTNPCNYFCLSLDFVLIFPVDCFKFRLSNVNDRAEHDQYTISVYQISDYCPLNYGRPNLQFLHNPKQTVSIFFACRTKLQKIKCSSQYKSHVSLNTNREIFAIFP